MSRPRANCYKIDLVNKVEPDRDVYFILLYAVLTGFVMGFWVWSLLP